MATLYVQEQGAKVHKRDHLVQITKQGALLQEVPLDQIDQVVLMGRGVQISTAALVDFLTRDVPVLITDQQGSRLYVHLTRGVSRFAALRVQQMELMQTPPRALDLGRRMILAKLTNQRAFLGGTGWPTARMASAQITQQMAAVASAATIDMVRGYEGAAAAAYFAAWKAGLPHMWQFNGRNAHPPLDPVNALLSFGYTLALNEVLAAVQMVGLDPYLGSFHVTEPGRPSLALDLLEEFRPLLTDRLVLDLLRSGQITPQQFERPRQQPTAVYLDAEGRAAFVAAYHRLLQSSVPLGADQQTTLRRMVQLQAYTLARVVRGEQERYVGFTPA